MLKKVFNIYLIPLLISLSLTMIMISVLVERDYLQIFSIFVGTLLGTFLLDMDYLLHAYFLDPEAEFSRSVQGYVKHKDILGLMNFIYYHRHDVKEKTLNSALFQVIFAALTLMIVATPANILLKAMVISILANTIYKGTLYYTEGKLDEWFWSIGKKPDKNGFFIYTGVLVLVLIFSFYFFY